jgi:NifB/MoaA-like Fe-S oxidoreductase
VGLTKFRQGLAPVQPFDRESAKAVMAIAHDFQQKLLDEIGTRFVFPADEMVLISGEELPPEEEYEGYPQLDNGVGLLRSTETEILDALEDLKGSGEIEELTGKELSVTLATGMAALDFMQKMCLAIHEAIPNITFDVVGIRNRFFGESVTVSGLLCGCDLAEQLKEKRPSLVFFPAVALRHERDLFLDDMTVAELEKRVGCPAVPVENGAAIFDALKSAVKGE